LSREKKKKLRHQNKDNKPEKKTELIVQRAGRSKILEARTEWKLERKIINTFL
jgi:hypothetical protein